MGIASFRHLLVHTLIRNAFIDYDKFGNEQHSTTAETYKSRIEGKNTLVRNVDGQEVTSTRRAIVDTGQGDNAVIFDVRDQITLPTQFWPASKAAPAIMSVQPRIGPEGVDHLEVFL